MKRSRLWTSPIGNHLGMIFTSSGVPVFSLGPQYLYFIIFYVTSLIFQSLFIIVTYHLLTVPQKFTLWLSFVVNQVCLLYAGLINPGIKVGQNMKQNEILKVFNDRSFCRVCEVVRDTGCLHCTDCDLCIEQRKFHSLVVGKCIGRKNFYAYYLWAGGTVVTFLQILLAICVKI